jgi:hypothetical protein
MPPGAPLAALLPRRTQTLGAHKEQQKVDPDSHSAISRIGAHVSWANTVDRKARMAPAIAANPGSDAYWIKKVRENPAFDGATEQQVLDAAASAKKAHFFRLGRASAKARRTKAAGGAPDAA